MKKKFQIDAHRYGTASQAITEAKRRLWVALDDPAPGTRRSISVVKCDYVDKTWDVELEVKLDRADQYFR